MPVPANDECCNWDDDITAAVTAGVMVWTGSAQTGKNVITWSQFKAAVDHDGLNPGVLADNQCPRYDALLARSVTGTVPSDTPTGATFANSGGGNGLASWTNTSATDAIRVQYYRDSEAFGTVVELAANTTTDTKSGYTSGHEGTFEVWYYNGFGNGGSDISNPVNF